MLTGERTLDNNVRAIVFASGRGSNAINIIETAKRLDNISILALICDNEYAKIIHSLESMNIPVYLIVAQKKATFEKEVLKIIRELKCNWIFLAGFMKILSESFIDSFSKMTCSDKRIVNIHPSLLPKYPGLNAYERSYLDKNNYHGVTLHYVDHGIDTGEIIKQIKYKVDQRLSLDQFKLQGLELEHKVYQQFLENLNNGKINELNTQL